MRVLIACESSGVLRNAFRALGHDAWSCDLQPADDGHVCHIQGDAIAAIANGLEGEPWELVIGHPPCTHLSASGARWWKAKQEDGRQAAGVAFFLAMVHACESIGCKWAMENPIGIMSSVYRKPDQIVQPWQFGDDASKATCLWTSGLPALRATASVAPRMVNGKPRFANQTDSGQNRLSPSTDRWKLRSVTYAGIANAMASQWGNA
jgi:hypothetical protein